MSLLEFYYINEPSVTLQRLITNSTLVHLIRYICFPKVKSFLVNILAPANSLFSVPSIIKSKLYNYLYIIKYSNAISDLILSREVRGLEIDESKIEMINQNILFVNKNSNLMNLYFDRIDRPEAIGPFYAHVNLPNIDKGIENQKAFMIDIKR